MKEVNIYIRVHQVRNANFEVDKLIGCLLLEYRGKKKYVFAEDLEESTVQRGLLKLINEGVNMLKESCNIEVHAVTRIALHTKQNSDMKEQLLNLISSNGHSYKFSFCHENEEGERAEIFKKFKSIMNKYKRDWKKSF